MAKKLVQFDWAIKKLLRHKTNFSILEGFLSELLGFDLTIDSILESEGNQSDADDKHNRVDILVRSTEDELMLVEIQNDPQIDYFHRMIYGASKLITEYIQRGDPYGTVKKVFSVNIVYFDLGQGSDYIYEYRGHFEGRHQKDVLQPSQRQQHDYHITEVADIFPKYYLLKVNNFDDVARSSLDEWIYFLKNSEVKEEFGARGLNEAREKLREESLTTEERKAYERYQESRRVERSVLDTAMKEGMEEGLEKGMEKGRKEGSAKREKEIIRSMHGNGLAAEQIAEFTKIPLETVRRILQDFT